MRGAGAGMNTRLIAGGAGVAAVLALTGVGVSTTLTSNSSAVTTTVSVPAPGNCRAYDVGATYAKVNCGPSVVGPLTIEPNANGRSAIIRWGASKDDLYPAEVVTYDFKKNSTYLWRGRAQTYATVGFTKSVRSFTTCVIPHSTSGFGRDRCVTWTAP